MQGKQASSVARPELVDDDGDDDDDVGLLGWQKLNGVHIAVCGLQPQLLDAVLTP